MERSSTFQANKYLNSHKSSEYIIENYTENMTQDSGLIEDSSDNLALIGLNCDVINNCDLEITDFEARHEFNELEQEANANLSDTSNNNGTNYF